MRASTISVTVVGGHPVIGGLVRLACEALEGSPVMEEISSLAEARRVLEASVPDVLVLDLDLPDGDGLVLLEELHARLGENSRPKVLALSDRSDGATVLKALRLGANGYLTKGDGLRGLTAALRGVVRGARIVAPELDAAAAGEVVRFARRTRARAAAENVLTVREREVLDLLALGLTMQQIGRRLSISPRTVESHARSVYRKLGVRTRLQAISRGAGMGLIDLGR